MGTPWSLKGSKDPPLLALDEFLILDSDDGDPATKNKRVTLATVQANLVTSVDANDFNITKLNSISINDSANNNTFTISSSVDLAADRTINLPLVTADDTFAMLGVSNRFTENNTFEKNILLVSDVSCTSIFSTVAANNGLGARLVGQFTRGTIASQLPILDNDRLYVLLAAGFDGTIFANAASLVWSADGNWSGANHGSSLTFVTTPTNSIIPENSIIIKNKVISFEDNDLENIKSVTITLPVSTFAEGLSIGNTDGRFIFGNATSNANEFEPLMTLSPKGSANAFFTEVFIDSGDDTGLAALSVLNVGTTTGSIANRPLWQLQNSSTTQVSVAATGDWNFVGNAITNVVLQSNLTDGSILIGNESNVSKDFPTGLQVKIDCRVATTADIDLSVNSDPSPIDGITLADNDRILLKNQTDASENGIYDTVTAVNPITWIRSADANTTSEVIAMFTKITEGDLNANTAFVLSNPDDLVLGTTELTFDKFSFPDIAHLNANNIFTEDNTFFDTIFITPDDFNDSLLNMGAFGDVPGQGPLIRGTRSRGTSSSPTAVQNNDILFELAVQGFNGTDFANCGNFKYQAAGTFTAIPLNQPTKFTISTNAPLTNQPVSRLVIGSDGTSDFQGNNITNAVLQSTLTNGSIFVGNESNVSEDFPTQLETKIDCRVATTTANIDLSVNSDPSPIDGITLVNLDRILLKNQTTASQNGIYVAVIATDPTNWVRSGDADNDSLVNNGMFIKITEGDLNANTAFELITPDPIAVNATDLLFEVFSLTSIAHLNGTQTFTDAQTIAATTATDLTLTPPSAPTGSASDFTANLDASSGTIAFVTAPQTGDFIGTNFAIQTLTNPMSGTITDAATLRISGEPVASTNVTITNNAALHVAAGLSKFDGNIQVGSRLQELKGADVASADVITLVDGNTFIITGTVTINHMINTDWQSGSKVTLLYPTGAGVTIESTTGGTTGDQADFFLSADSSFDMTAGASLTLVYEGVANLWREIGRSIGV